MNKGIDKYKVLAALVRSFFDAFASGVIDSHTTDAKEKSHPQAVKKLMLEHYEHIAPAFFDTIFYPLAAMNYQYEDIAHIAVEAQKRGDDMMALVRTACASEALYAAMVDEYKRNFSNLLAGRFASNAEHLAAYKRAEADSEATDNVMVATDKAIQLTVRVVMFAYARGIRQAAKERGELRQATLFRLMLDAMNVLLNEKAVDFTTCETDSLGDLFLRVCSSQQNFTVMTDEMDRTYVEINKLTTHQDQHPSAP